MRTTPLFRAYSLLTRAALPIAATIERRKLVKAGVSKARQREKSGYASEPRPQGQLIWFHAASVGESVSVLALIDRIGTMLPDAHFLITSGTSTSAAVVSQRLPRRCIHQFAPLDARGPVDRFLAHWSPQAAIFVESELWPQMLVRTRQLGTPLALVNARMSDRSLAGWQKRPDTAAMLLRTFDVILTQTQTLAQAMIALGAAPEKVSKSANLKALSAPLPVDQTLVVAMQDQLAGRSVWIAASTHDGEEGPVLDAHATLLNTHPGLCLILAPRHPERGDDVAKLIADRGWPVHRRSAADMPRGEVFLADSLGELGSWYALSGIVFLGGSLLPIGGHNPYEVAQAGAAVVSGKHVTNFEDTYAGLVAAGGATLIEDQTELTEVIANFLTNPNHLQTARGAATDFGADQIGALDNIATRLVRDLAL